MNLRHIIEYNIVLCPVYYWKAFKCYRGLWHHWHHPLWKTNRTSCAVTYSLCKVNRLGCQPLSQWWKIYLHILFNSYHDDTTIGLRTKGWSHLVSGLMPQCSALSWPEFWSAARLWDRREGLRKFLRVSPPDHPWFEPQCEAYLVRTLSVLGHGSPHD